MATHTDPSAESRTPLNRERVLHAGVHVADADGIESVTMRRLGQELGVKAMSLYNHVDSKEDLLNGMVDVVVNEINEAVHPIDRPPDQWKADLRRRILAARQVLLRHPWAPAVIESRTDISTPVMRYFDDLAGLLRKGGFSVDLVHHAMHALGSRALGFSQELFKPGNEEIPSEMSTVFLRQLAEEYPYITEVTGLADTHDPESTLGWCDDQTEFEFGLDLLLNGLERLRERD